MPLRRATALSLVAALVCGVPLRASAADGVVKAGLSANGGDAVDFFLNLFVVGLEAMVIAGEVQRQEDAHDAATGARRGDEPDGARPPGSDPFEERDSAGREFADQDGSGPYRRPRRARVVREREARQGALFSFGLGGASQYVSGVGRSGAFDLDMRLGYGFSDRFQFFFDANALASEYNNYGSTLTSWTVTMRGQTVLIGDRAGNGLNINFGAGLGGLAGNFDGYPGSYGSRVGFAMAGGLSFDARVTRSFAFSPEFFVSWHAIPNGRDVPQDIATAVGFRLNFLWYGP